MKTLINALSVTNLSGRHVLLGHLKNLVPWTLGKHEYIVLFHPANRDIRRDFGPNLTWRECPAYTAGWGGRTWWEQTQLPRLIRRIEPDFVFTPSGAITPILDVPQVSYAMNPWALVQEVDKTPIERVKAALQLHGYRSAVKKAAMMLYLSKYMRQVYRDNAGCRERASEIVYTGLDEAVFRKAEVFGSRTSKTEFQVLCVSVMAPHKDLETLVRAIAELRKRYRLPARLVQAGPWADRDYEKKIRRLVDRLGLDGAVEFKGHLPLDELLEHYSRAKVFALMSRCESFGIPAVEAQAFGTPVVSSNCCAIPEVCGEGGIYPPPGDVGGTAAALARLLTDGSFWDSMSGRARENAERFRWETCTRSLAGAFNLLDG